MLFHPKNYEEISQSGTVVGPKTQKKTKKEEALIAAENEKEHLHFSNETKHYKQCNP